MMFIRVLAVTAVLIAVACAAPRLSLAADPLENVVLLDLKDGRVTILLRPDLAPKHVERVKKLTREGFYDGIVFHRVIAGLHGADRRSDRHRHRRLEISRPSGGVHQ